MKPLNIFFCFIILLFAFESSITNTCLAGSLRQEVGGTWRVTIYNYQTNLSLALHCKSKDNDLGEHIVGVGGQYYWTFKENFWQTTLFWCNFGNEYGLASFEVFWPEKGSWLSDRCNYVNCMWVARDDGFYLTNIPKKQIEFMHKWEPRA